MAFTDAQIAQLSAPLDRKHVKSRQQAGRNLSYIEGWHAIAEANRIFGFDAWDRETVDLRCVVERETKLRSGADAWRVAYICKVRIGVVDDEGKITREGTGYGSGIDQDLGAAHESAVKEAETDAMKRALMTFGNPFGLALYDKMQAEVSDVTAQSGVVDNRAGVRSASGNSREGERPSPSFMPDQPGSNGEPSDRAIAAAAYKRIKSALRAAKTPGIVGEILDVNEHDMQFLMHVGRAGYDDLLSLASARRAELAASA